MKRDGVIFDETVRGGMRMESETSDRLIEVHGSHRYITKDGECIDCSSRGSDLAKWCSAVYVP